MLGSNSMHSVWWAKQHSQEQSSILVGGQYVLVGAFGRLVL